MYYLDESSIANSIDYFKDFKAVNPMAAGAFWIFKNLGFSTYKKKFYDEWKSDVPPVAWLLGSIYDEVEESDEYLLIFPFSINSIQTKQDFYNPRTVLKNMASRLKDTTDNSLIDYYIKKTGNKSDGTEAYLFTSDYIETEFGLLNNQKIELCHFLAWLYRFTKVDIDELITGEDFFHILKSKFVKDFKINDVELPAFFKQSITSLAFSSTRFTGHDLRKLLKFDKTIPINPILISGTSSYTFSLNKVDNHQAKEYIMYLNDNPSPTYIATSLEIKGQLIIYGPPGTSKTYSIKKEIAKNYNKLIQVQFHPNTTYEDFIGGLFPDKDGKFTYRKGVLLRAIDMANALSGTDKVLLFIDEINRGNLSSILGEAIAALDRSYKVQLANFLDDTGSSYELSIPKNLHIIGTMNSSDKSISIEDKAIIRRFHKLKFFINYEILENLSDTSKIGINLAALLKELNNRIYEELNDPDYQIGQAYFMPQQLFDTSISKFVWDKHHFVHVFNEGVIPLLEEYTVGSPESYTKILGTSYGYRIFDFDKLKEEVISKII
ncbi:McrB family protein [Pontibacter chinhatensis]|uniref:5-methylcytosine-specific restriction enzyme B n=1 Tax=Pontibacter chinhatensis TaxID=1436961 RepID=A0A1I2ZS91_9BACT|nr:AAA family ATPase [Pontibacter chinhatensis]SFH40678.1 5-methylcytosine-specific restriction enzyme B [Pontibacter chinhatensis]